ncbi:probable UDP-N-acetylglucosamine--peptide N-acetylglucosaminyltransferase SPINDLY [Macadamia integrifolia]|uniref:probable UDP-N-acetylglucosamine--peptide N-acetylglucosaminyltransferase SPINDLY n=1 Tax=Macadamia integrifolia TaxID=60698 RepID=UPI001C4E392C|nr:probable UDP-N-acetylglucosamine--peptide N-acetylglucosaminyltransferase SPINDLY [Macadamia integrifolia]
MSEFRKTLAQQQEPVRQHVSVQKDSGVVEGTTGENSKITAAATTTKKSLKVVIADLNVDPPESDGDDCAVVAPPDSTRSTNDENCGERSTATCKDTDATEGDCRRLNKLAKCRSRINKGDGPPEYGPDTDADHQCQGVPSSREEKVSSLKTGLVHVARKMPKNAHAQFILGLMYQRLGQPQKAVLAYEKAEEILLRSEEEIDRPEFLSLVQIHHAQCLMLGSTGDNGSDKELAPEELEEILLKLKESVESDVRQAAVWNTLGLILLRTGRLQSAISVLSSLLSVTPDHLDSLANLGIMYLQSGNLELSTKCFQDLILKDQNHPAALINYAALLLSKYGSVIAGAGANGGERASVQEVVAANVAKECLSAAVKADPRAAHAWVNLANAYYMCGDHRSAAKCLEKAAKLDPNCMSTRYAVALHRIKDAERSQDPTEQLLWAANEIASIIRDGDSSVVELRIAWAGLALVHKAQHEIAAAFETGQKDLTDVEERALYTLKQAIEEDPDDAMQWHQLGLHNLCTLQFMTSQKYLKAAIARCKDCSYAWSNLGISLQLSEDPSQAEEVYKHALSLAAPHQAHATFSNLGNLYRQQKRYEHAKAMLAKSLELYPGYAPAYNNLGLVFVAEGRWEDAKICFEKALQSDSLLDAAKSNIMKAEAMSRVCTAFSASNSLH